MAHTPGRVLPLPALDCRLAGSCQRCDSNRYLCRSTPHETALSLSSRRLALVFGDVVTGERLVSGWRSGYGGSFYLRALDGPVSHRRVGRAGSFGPLAVWPNRASCRGWSRDLRLRDYGRHASAILEEQLDPLDARLRSDRRQSHSARSSWHRSG